MHTHDFVHIQGKKAKDLAADLGVDIDGDLVVPADERCGDCYLTLYNVHLCFHTSARI